MKRLALVSLVALAAAQAAHAQVTNIAPDTAAGVSLGTTVNQSSNTYTIDGGTTAGTNLFHSFTTFDVGAGDMAQWVYSSGDPASITNVINRVTGGSPSSILGVLDSTAIPNADFYFINPAGIVFGGDSVVNVPAAAHFSTAIELRFADGKVLSVATPSGSTLSVAAPQSFGFLGNEGDIVHDANHYSTYEPFLPGSGEITFSAANITMLNAFMGAREIALTAVGAEAADVPVDGLDPQQSYGGSINMVNSWLQTWPVDCYEDCYGYSGHIVLNGGSILLEGTGIVAEFDSPENSGGTSFVEVLGRDSVVISNSFILADGYGAADAGSVSIGSSGDVTILDSIVLAYTQGAGQGGTVDIHGANVLVSGGVIGSESVGPGNGGSVFIEADDQLIVENFAWILSTAWDSGNAGAVTLTASDIVISDSLVASESYGTGNAGTVAIDASDSVTAFNSVISSSTYGEGNGGSVDVQAGALLHMDASSITSNSWTAGNAGGVSVVAGEALLMNGSVISSDGFVDGDAGDVSVAVIGHLQVEGGSQISSSAGEEAEPAAPGGSGENLEGEPSAEMLGGGVSIASSPPPPAPPAPPLPSPPTLGEGDAGSVNVTAGSITLIEESAISSRSYGLGNGGSVIIETAGDLVLDASLVTSDSVGAGDAGDVRITAQNATFGNVSKVSSGAMTTGNAGNVYLAIADTLKLNEFSNISTDAGGLGSPHPPEVDGEGGDVEIHAGAIDMLNSSISAVSATSGNSGNILVQSDAVSMRGSSITTSVIGLGNAGSVTLLVSGLLSAESSGISSNANRGDGSGDAGSVFVSAQEASLLSSAIESNAIGGNAGSVMVVVADGLALVDSEVSSSTPFDSSGDGGDVSVSAGSLDLDNSRVVAVAYGNGDGGRVEIAVAGPLNLANQSAIQSDSWGGNAGGVVVAADSINMSDFSEISSAAHAPDGGRSGTVTISTGMLSMTEGSQISTTSANSNAAGRIEIAADTLLMTGEFTGISSENVGETGGAAGSIVIHSDAVSITEGARVSTNSLTGAAGDITFDMAPGSLLILSGETLPGIIETSSGPGTGGIITIASPLAIISHGGVISALGQSGGANVHIDANYFIASSDRLNVVEVDGTLSFSNAIYDVSSGTTDADLSIIDASGVLQGQCSTVRATGQASQLNIRPAGPFGAADWRRLPPATQTAGTSVGGCQ